MDCDGVCYRDEAHGFWTATFIDRTSSDARAACEIAAIQAAHPRGLPEDGRVALVKLVEVEAVADQANGTA